MKLGTLMMVKSIVCLVFGVIFVASPGILLALFGVPNLNESGVWMTRLYGSAFIGLGLLLWFIRNTSDSTVLRGVALAVSIGDGIGFLVVLLGQVGGVMNALGWSVVALYLLLTVGFGYFLVAKPVAQPHPGQVS
ncbi:MAG TPA: hypothetical protein VIX58_08900 [Anaerolineae bacterium]